MRAGASIPTKANDAFPLFQIPPTFRIFENLGKFFQLFSKNFVSSTKVSDDFFLVIDCEFRISPLFLQDRNISPLFREIYYFPLFFKFPPDFVKCTCCLHTLHVFRFSRFFDHSGRSSFLTAITPQKLDNCYERKRPSGRWITFSSLI